MCPPVENGPRASFALSGNFAAILEIPLPPPAAPQQPKAEGAGKGDRVH